MRTNLAVIFPMLLLPGVGFQDAGFQDAGFPGVVRADDGQLAAGVTPEKCSAARWNNLISMIFGLVRGIGGSIANDSKRLPMQNVGI